MALRHVAMFRWADHVGPEHVDRVRAAYDELATRLGGIRHHVHGSDLGVSDGGYDYLVVADFDSVEQWRAYRDDPAHVLLVEELLTGHVVDRAGGQFPLAAAAGPPAAPPTDPMTGTDEDESDAALLERARRAAAAEMAALLAEPDD